MRVLLVDDEKELASALAERLNLRGLDAQFVVSGKEAVDKSKENSYDVVVLDLKMPGMDGLAVMKIIKEKNPQTGFVFLTGYGSKDERDAGTAAGAAFYLMKPVKISVLMEKISQAAEMAKAQQEG